MKAKQFYDFKNFRLDLEERVLLRDGKFLSVTPKAFQLLEILVRNHGHIVEKQNLIAEIWADSFVEENNLAFTVRQLRKALGDDAHQPTFIETVPRRGYRFIAEVKSVSENEELNDFAQTVLPSAEKDGANPQNFERPRFFAVLTAIFVVGLVGFAALYISGFANFLESDAPILTAPLNFESVSITGEARHLHISPDGKFVAYINHNNDKQSLWLENLQDTMHTELLPPDDYHYVGITFSNNSEFIYFVRKTPFGNQQTAAIYRISLFGGIPEKLFENTQGWISLSPDDRRIAFVRYYENEENWNVLMVADIDGGNERKLAVRKKPDYFTLPVWSPDGETIAYSVGHSHSGARDQSLFEVNVKDGTERAITKQKFFHNKGIVWLPNKSGLIFTATEDISQMSRIWKVSYRTGNVEALTDNSVSYAKISLDKAASKLIANQTITDFRLSTADFSDPSRLKPISSANGEIAFVSGNKIIYSNYRNGQGDIWIMNADGTQQRQLTNDPANDVIVIVSPDERYIFFTSNRSGTRQIWRMNFDGSDQKQITHTESGYPVFVSPDGGTLYFWSGINRNLWKVSTEPGGTETLFLDKYLRQLAFSPDGKFLAYVDRDNEKPVISVISTENMQIKSNFTPAEEISPGNLEWASDSQTLYYISRSQNKQNVLWRQSLDGAAPSKIADLGSEHFVDFSISSDNQKFAVVHGDWKHTAVLIKGLK